MGFESFNAEPVVPDESERVDDVAKAIGMWAKETFIYIHSEMRVLCFVSAALGACVGYFLGSATIGAIAGCVFGIVNYEIVSKRILGVVKTN